MSVIGGYNSLMLQALGEEDPMREDAQEIARATDRASSLTHQLLAFSRRQTLSPKVINLNHVLSETEKLLRRLIGEDIDFTVELCPELWNLTADPGQIEQVITNLALNARDAMPAGGALRISTQNLTLLEPTAGANRQIDPGEYVSLIVADSGSGIEPHVLEHIFEPFFTTKEIGRGTGLGLATVHGIVEQSGGRISVESRPGKGTTFRIYFPRASGVQEPSVAAAGPAALPRGDATILVVDDEAPVRRLMRRVLERHGYRVLEAADPVDALENVLPQHLNRVQLAISDVVMPHMSGSKFAEILRDEHPELKVLLMTGYTDEKLSPEVREGALLRKPFAPNELLAAVRRILAQ